MRQSYARLASAIALSIFFAATSTAIAAEENTQGIHNDSEAGVVATSGNSQSQTLNFGQRNSYGWDLNVARFDGRYLNTSANGNDTALYWYAGLRYERELSPRVSAFAGQAIESDRFAGFFQRYNTDLGGKYRFIKEEDLSWFGEAGYRFTTENRTAGQVKLHYVRLYTEVNRAWTKTFSTKLWVEVLPNLTNTEDYQLNVEPSLNAALSEIFAVKIGLLIKNRGVPPAPATKKTDTQFTTALVAKF